MVSRHDNHLPPHVVPIFGVFRTKEAADYVGLAESTMEKKRVYGGGPQFLKYSTGAVRYLEEDLISWRAQFRTSSTSEL